MFFLLIGLGIAIPTSEFFTFDTLSQTISEIPIDKIIASDKEEPKIYTYLEKIGLSKEKIYTFLDKLKFKNILGENLSSKILNKINNFEIKLPDEDKVTDFIYENLEYLKRIFFFSTTREDVYSFVHKNYEFINDFLDDISDKMDFSGFENLKSIATLIRKATVYLIEIGLAICLVLLIIFRASLYKCLMWIHAVTLPVAIIFITIGTLGTNLVYAIVEKLRILFLIEPFVTYFTKSMVNYGV
ncbi:MAG: hypothetical protein J6X03_02625, partial [Bacilli bacterium]|nr:hypothetical protein [Bacilli bacterium]